MNDWKKIRAHYSAIGNSFQRNEWACNPYAFEEAGITLTPIESWLWHDIRAVDAVLYPQFPVAGFFVDFANPVAKVAIECDGKNFHTNIARDELRDKKLASLGWNVYRITGADCRSGVGEESPGKSAARHFIESIASIHGIKRP